MSQITEYLKLLPKALPNADKIIKGIVTEVQYKRGFLKEEEKAELVRRRVICAGCPFMSNNAKTSEEYLSLTGKNYKTARKEDHCSFCGCGIKRRTSSFEANCGAETWNKENPDKTIALKWTEFKSNKNERKTEN
jgi:hypothetical protein